MTTTMTFGQWVKQRRKSLGLSQEQLGQLVPCSPETIRKIEADARRPSLEIARRLAQSLKIPAGEQTAFLQRARPDLALTPDQAPSSVLAPFTPIIGREREQEQASALLRRHDVRLLTLTGPGGTGKTRLALEIANALAAEYADSMASVMLAGVQDPHLVIPTIVQALGLKEQRHLPILQYLQEHLHDKQMLLLLDNFEQLLPAAPDIADLLSAAPQLKLIVTSRARLSLTSEHEFHVPPLELPGSQPPPPVNELLRYPAIALFTRRMAETGLHAELAEADVLAISTICARLDGLPLAIELAAARTRVLRPRELLRLISDAHKPRTIDLLSGGAKDLPLRQQTIRNTIDWSYQLLDAEEQQLFRQLSVFVGGWSIDAATSVVDGDDSSELAQVQLLDSLASLLNQSLILREERAEETRFSMLETIREYAAERLERGGEAGPLRERHMRYYFELGRLAEPHLSGPHQDAWTLRLRQEYDNVRAALVWLLEQEQGEQALLMMVALWRFWQVQGYNSEARHWFERALALHTRQHPDPRTSARARALWALGWLSFDLSEHQRSKSYFAESLAIARAIGDRAIVGLALHGTGKIAEIEGDYQRAIAEYQESLAIARALNNSLEIAWSLDHLGVLLRIVGRTAEAQAYFEESLQVFRQLQDRQALIWSLIHLGSLLGDQGEYASASALLEECVRLAQESENPGSIAWATYTLGYIRMQQARYPSALKLLNEGLEIFRQLDYKRGVMVVLFDLAMQFYLQGQVPQAVALFEESHDYAQQLSDHRNSARALIALGRIALDRGRLAEAQRQLRAGLQLYREGLSYALAAAPSYQDQQVVQSVAEGLEELARLWWRQGRRAQSATLIGALDRLSTPEGATRPALRERYAQTRASLRATLDDEDSQQTWQRGAGLSLPQALELALSI